MTGVRPSAVPVAANASGRAAGCPPDRGRRDSFAAHVSGTGPFAAPDGRDIRSVVPPDDGYPHEFALAVK